MVTPSTPAERELQEFLLSMREMRARMTKPSTFIYLGVEDYLLKHGQFFTPTPLPKTVRAMQMQRCFENAFRVASRTTGYHYVEGYAIGVMPLYHAWLVDKDGHVIDPTWTEVGTAYYGVELDLAAVKLSRRGGQLALLEDWKRDFPALQGHEVRATNAWFKR